MKQKRSIVASVAAGRVLALLSPAPPSASAQTPAGSKVAATQPVVSPEHKAAFEAFEKRVKEYVALRESVEGKMPKLSKEAKPEEIERHKVALQKGVQAARASAKQGDLFEPTLAAHIRDVIKSEMPAKVKKEVRETVIESEVKAVPLRVNNPYPESQEQLEMPPALLLRLPQLPKQVKFRYVGRNMLLVDRENGLIIDFMTDALP